ncbi:Cullin 3, partial [Cryptococcus deuterogattii 99/473]
ASRLSFEEHYRYAYNLVLFKHGDQLYNGVRTLVIEHLDRLAEEKIVPTFPRSGGTRGAGKLGGGAEAVERATEGDRFLKAVKGVWEDHTGSMRKLKDVLKYMAMHAPTAGVPPVYDLGLSLFLIHIIRRPTIHTHLISTLLSQVQLEREGFTITRSTVRECIDILLRLKVPERDGGASVYQQDFEPEFLRRSGEWYEYEAGEELVKSDASLYLSNVSRRLAEEHDRTIHYLSPSTLPHLQSLLIASLLTPHLTTILNMPGSGLVQMVDKDRYADLKRLYELFGKVPADQGMEALKKAIRLDIDARGKSINSTTTTIQQQQQPSQETETKPKPTTPPLTLALQWVHSILLLFDKYTLILSSSFASSLALQSTINSSFQNVINAHPRAPEFLSLYIDETLKKGKGAKGIGGGGGGVTEEEIEEAKEKTIRIFRFLTDKDKFERYYKNHLARRLLSGKSVGGDAEQEMVGRLKKEVGFQFTHRLEGMFTDMRLSDEAANIFGNDPRYSIPFTLHVSVLTSSNWPPSTLLSLPLTFPPPLLPALELYQTFYDSRHSGRRLTWQGLLGSADLKVRTRKGQWEVNLSTLGMVVLLAFSDLPPGDILSYNELKTQTSLPDAELARTLQSLACGKHRLLVKHPKGRDIGKEDTFEFNDSFSSPLARIKILQIAPSSASTSASASASASSMLAGGVENAQEREETERQIDEERKHQTEACIVRIMKDRKTMRHNDLVSEVAHQLAKRFVAAVPMIKKRIEGLIDREYLERTEDMGSYRYLA